MRGRFRGEVYVVMAASLWGTYGVAFKLGVQSGCDKWILIVLRPLLASLVTVPSAFMLREKILGRWALVVGLAGLAPLYITYPLAVEEIGVGLAAVLLYTAPLWVTLFSPLLGEPPSRHSIIGALIGFSGVVLIFSWDLSLSNTRLSGLALGLGAGLSYATYIVLARAARRGGASTSEASLGAVAVASLPVFLAARPSRLPEGLEVGFGLYLAFGATVIPYFLHVHGLGRVEASKVSVLSLVEPVVAVVLGVIFLGENVGLAKGLGAFLVLLSGFLVVRR